MSELSLTAVSARAPRWLTAAALAGIAWNLFGAVQFVGSVTATETSLVAQGLTATQAALMTGYPVWMTGAFAVGVSGGLVGSVLLLMRHPAAMPVLGVSLAAYIALWMGDLVYGVFAALGIGQVAILSVVVAIAAALFALSRLAAAKG